MGRRPGAITRGSEYTAEQLRAAQDFDRGWNEYKRNRDCTALSDEDIDNDAFWAGYLARGDAEGLTQ